MILNIDTSVPLTSQDKQILLILLGETSPDTHIGGDLVINSTTATDTTARTKKAAEPEAGPTVEDAAKFATDIFTINGGRAAAKEYLATLGHAKVRELTAEEAPGFIEAMTKWKAEQPDA